MFNYKDLRHVTLKLEGRFLHIIKFVENNLANSLFVKTTCLKTCRVDFPFGEGGYLI
jgi:hypothetical protein